MVEVVHLLDANASLDYLVSRLAHVVPGLRQHLDDAGSIRVALRKLENEISAGQAMGEPAVTDRQLHHHSCRSASVGCVRAACHEGYSVERLHRHRAVPLIFSMSAHWIRVGKSLM